MQTIKPPILILLLMMILLITTNTYSQGKMRRDVLIMLDSLEMAYARACPEIPLSKVSQEHYDNDVANIEAMNEVYYDSCSFTLYATKLLQHDFYIDWQTDDSAHIKKARLFSKKHGNITLGIELSYINDSVVDRLVTMETDTHPYCVTKKKGWQIYWLDVYYVRRFVSIIDFPFIFTISEPTGPQDFWDNLEPIKY